MTNATMNTNVFTINTCSVCGCNVEAEEHYMYDGECHNCFHYPDDSGKCETCTASCCEERCLLQEEEPWVDWHSNTWTNEDHPIESDIAEIEALRKADPNYCPF